MSYVIYSLIYILAEPRAWPLSFDRVFRISLRFLRENFSHASQSDTPVEDIQANTPIKLSHGNEISAASERHLPNVSHTIPMRTSGVSFSNFQYLAKRFELTQCF